MTVDEYLKFNYELKGCTLPREPHLAEICEVVRISDVRRKLIRNLSKGYKQRVGVAGALVGNPPVIIFDEPTVGLDPKQIIEIRGLIRTLGKDDTVLVSTHILGEVAAVCDRIIIINKGKIVADELTENITRTVENNRRYTVKICGPQKEVLAMLKSKPGIVYAELLSQRDGDAYSYMIESEVGIDIRKSLFYSLAEKKWPLVGMEALGMSLEDIFITIVDQTSTKSRYERRDSKSRRNQYSKTRAEAEIAKSILEKNESNDSDLSQLFDESNDK
jgi:ABC-2 type transport system ATP-binding protein